MLTSLGLDAGLSLEEMRQLRSAASVEDAFQRLNPSTATDLGRLLAATVEQRSQAYIARYGDWPLRIAAVLFDRSRTLRWRGPMAEERFFTLKD